MMEIAIIHPHFGAEVAGVALKDGLDSPHSSELRELFHTYKLLLVRD
jgi:alpha-ketoglutarate-dependent taurine dioxygenase